MHYKIFWRRVGIDPEFQFKKKKLDGRGNIGMFVVVVDPIKYYYITYEVKVQVSFLGIYTFKVFTSSRFSSRTVFLSLKVLLVNDV